MQALCKEAYYIIRLLCTVSIDRAEHQNSDLDLILFKIQWKADIGVRRVLVEGLGKVNFPVLWRE